VTGRLVDHRTHDVVHRLNDIFRIARFLKNTVKKESILDPGRYFENCNTRIIRQRDALVRAFLA